MNIEPKVLTTTTGERVSLTPFDLKEVKTIPEGVEVVTHAGVTYKFPINRYIFNRMMAVDLSSQSNTVSVIPPIR